MFENNPGTHVNVIKYVLVGILLTVSIIALGWGVWSYTYQQNLQEIPDQETMVENYEEEWNAIRSAATTTRTDEYEEEWASVRGQGTTTRTDEYEEEWASVRGQRSAGEE